MRREDLLVLRIKKFWLNKIRSGEKRIEYRKDSTYYRSIFKKGHTFTHVQFHYQNANDKPIYKIIKIKKVKRPIEFENSTILPTPKVWAIYLDIKQGEII